MSPLSEIKIVLGMVGDLLLQVKYSLINRGFWGRTYAIAPLIPPTSGGDFAPSST